jgi:hypothetical protein
METTAKQTIAGCLDARRDELLDFADGGFVAAVEGPLADALAADQASVRQDFQVFARCRLADVKFPGDQYAAHAVRNEIPVDLRREVAARLAEPGEYLEPPLVGKSAEPSFNSHVEPQNLVIDN